MDWNSDIFLYIIYTLVLTISAIIASKLIRKLLLRFFEKSTKILRIDPTNYKFFLNAVSASIYTAAATLIFYIIPPLRALGVTLFASAGILTVIIGFASQQAFSNIVSGIFIVIFKPFRVGDWIKIGENVGTVEDITLRHTMINNPENRRIVIPNSIISSETILNSHIGQASVRNHFEVGISYDSDIEKAINIIREEAVKHEFYIDNRTDEEKEEDVHPVDVRVIDFGESSINLRAYIWSTDSANGFVMKSDLRINVKKRFDSEGIEIPFPYRTIVMKK